MTVFSLSLVSMPTVQAAAAGDLIKMNGLSSVYYLGADNGRYVFPNEATYLSWYSDFNGVKVIPQSELEQYALKANVTVRPGTKLIKSPSNPLVYSVEPGGELRSIVSEANAINLYGANWAKRVIDVIDSFFTNYHIGSALTAGQYPEGSLIKSADSADVYYIDADGKARKFASEASFTGNRFSFDNVLVASTIPTTGTAIAGVETALADTSSGAGGTPNSGSGLTVSLSGDTAPSRDIPSKTTIVPFVTVNLTAASDGDVKVNGLTFTRKGTGATADFDGGYLYVGEERLTNKRSVNSADNTLVFSAMNLTIPAGMTKAVTLRMDSAASASGNHYFQLTSASAVATNGATVSGSFPIQGNVMTYSTVEAATVTIDGQDNAPTYKIGESNVTLSEFTIANNNKEKVYVNRIRLKQGGTAGDAAIANLSLTIDDQIVAEGVSMNDKYVDFMLETPVEIIKSKTLTAVVKGDIADEIGKTIILYLKDKADADITGEAYGDFYGITITNTFLVTDGDTVEIDGSEINVSFDGPAATEIKDDTTNVVLANLKIKSTNQDVNFDTLRVVLASAGASNNLPMTNLEMVDSANGASYSVSDPASSTSANLDFENILLQKGVQYNFQIRGDVQDGTNAASTFAASINFASAVANYQDSDETAVVTGDYSASTLSGKTMTVAAPAITFAKVTTSASTVAKGADGVLLYKGKITANSVDALKISRVKILETTGDLLSADFDRVYLYKVNSDGTETKLDDETSLGQAYVSFSNFTLDVAKGLSNGVYIVVRGDVKSTPAATTTTLGWSSTKSDYNVKDSDSNAVAAADITIVATAGHATTVTTEGTFTLAIDTDMTGLNNNKNVLAGTKTLLGRIKLTAAKEAANLEDLVIENVGTADADTLATLYLYDNANMTGTALASADMASNNKVLFSDVNINIPTTGSTYLYIGGMVKSIDYSSSPSADATAAAGTTIGLRVPTSSGDYTTKVTGVSTGELLTDSHSATVFTSTSTVMGAVISALGTSYADKTLSDGTKDIFSFKVTAPASTNVDYNSDALAVKLATTTFTVSTSSGINISNLRIERVGGSNGEKTAIATFGLNTFTIGFQNTYGTLSDLKIKSGETAEFVVRATIAGSSGSGDSVEVSIENAFSANVPYFHNTTDATTYTSSVYPLISGTTYVRGGTLSN